jgi:hypothetical protein
VNPTAAANGRENEGQIVRKILVLAAAFSAIGATGAASETWVTVPANSNGVRVQYDADSAYVKTSADLVYVVTCGSVNCVAGDTAQATTRTRIDCTQKEYSTYLAGQGWTTPLREANNPLYAAANEYLQGSFADVTVDAVCAKKDSWPKR